MRISQLHRSRPARLLSLGFAVFATVATSQPSWGLQETAFDGELTIEPGGSAVKKIAYDGSQEVDVSTTITGSPAAGTKVRVAFDDGLSASSGPDAGFADAAGAGSPDAGTSEPAVSARCKKTWLFEADGKGDWSLGPEDATYLPVKSGRSPRASSCGQRTRDVATVTITNDAAEPLRVRLKIEGSISGLGSDDEPDGAFVHAKLVP